MKIEVFECCFLAICMYCSQNNVLITVISSGSYQSDCVLTTGCRKCRKNIFSTFMSRVFRADSRLKRFVECVFDLRLSTS